MNKRHWSAVIGAGRGGARRHRPHRPDAGSGNAGREGPGERRPRCGQASRADNLPNPLAEAQAARAQGRRRPSSSRARRRPKTINGNRVIEVKSTAKDRQGQQAQESKYVNYPVNREEDIFTILTDFGDTDHDRPAGGTAGPVHNQIPAPDRNWDGNATDDNSTYWVHGLQPRSTTRT